MAKQKSFLLVGLPHAGVPLLTAALEQHRDALAEHGVRVPAKSADEAFRAAVELRREHKAWGLRRRDVEGAWAGICRRALKTSGRKADTLVIGHELLAGAARDEIALLVDGLAGTHVHVVVLAVVPDGRVGLFPDELDLAGVLDRWQHAVTSPDRVHVVAADPANPVVAWSALGAVAGFDADRFPLPTPSSVVAPADTASLRLIAESSGVHVDHDELVELAERWGKVVADHGYDVIGDLRDLIPLRPAGSTDPGRTAYADIYNPAAPKGHRINEGSLMLNGTPIEPDDEFRVTMNSFLAAGGDNFPGFVAGTESFTTGDTDLTVLRNYFESFLPDPVPVDREPRSAVAVPEVFLKDRI